MEYTTQQKDPITCNFSWNMLVLTYERLKDKEPLFSFSPCQNLFLTNMYILLSTHKYCECPSRRLQIEANLLCKTKLGHNSTANKNICHSYCL